MTIKRKKIVLDKEASPADMFEAQKEGLPLGSPATATIRSGRVEAAAAMGRVPEFRLSDGTEVSPRFDWVRLVDLSRTRGFGWTEIRRPAFSNDELEAMAKEEGTQVACP